MVVEKRLISWTNESRNRAERLADKCCVQSADYVKVPTCNDQQYEYRALFVLSKRLSKGP